MYVQETNLRKINLTLKNSSVHSFKPGDVKIGVITSSHYSIYRGAFFENRSIKLPQGGYLEMLEKLPTLYPGSFYQLILICSKKYLQVRLKQ